MKILLAVDGSPMSTRAARHAAKLLAQLAAPSQLILFNADPPMMQAVAIKIGLEAAKRIHAENSQHAIRGARAALRRARVEFSERLVVGEPADAIIKAAKAERCDLIVMGTHGQGALQRLLLGSVASKVIAQTDIPVTVVR